MHGLPKKRGVGLMRPHFKQRDNAAKLDITSERELFRMFLAEILTNQIDTRYPAELGVMSG